MKIRVILVNGNWGDWMEWSVCSKTCGEGLKNRSRECNNPQPMFGGRVCLGYNTQLENCKDTECPGEISEVWNCNFAF